MNFKINKAAAQFGLESITIQETLSDGLIHNTYKIGSVSYCIILQQINHNVFKNPFIIVSNHSIIYKHLSEHAFTISKPLQTINGQLLWRNEHSVFWRAQEYIKNSYTVSDVNPQNAFDASNCFAGYTKTLDGIDTNLIQETISNFHDVGFRYSNLEKAIQHASLDRLQNANSLIEIIRSYKRLVDFYYSIANDSSFTKRIMHHDCKLSNVLFDNVTHKIICPIDLDTTMPGYFFSDIGDLIRSMAPSLDENSTDWEELTIKKEIYKSVLKGYLDGIGDIFSIKERKLIHNSGALLFFMQAVRFLEDYLSSDRYYKITYGDQNLNRAKNQLILLDRLNQMLKEEYNYFF